MVTGDEIPTPICETKMELGGATDSCINTLPPEEKTRADTPSTVEVDNNFKTPVISEVHLEVDYISLDTSKGTEKPNQTLIDDTAILLLRDDQQLEIATDDSKIIEQNTEESNNSEMERDKELENECEDLQLGEVSTGGTNDNEPTVIIKVKDEDEELDRAEMFENEKNTVTLLKEEAEKHVESSNVVPDNSIESYSSQADEVNSSLKHRCTNLNLHGITSEDAQEKTINSFGKSKEVFESLITIVSSSPKERNKSTVIQGVKSDGSDENTIDKVDMQKDVLENLSTIGSIEDTKERPLIKVDASETKAEEVLKNEKKLTFSEDIKAPDLDHGKQISSLDDQTVITHPLDALDGKTDDEALDHAAETNEKNLGVQNVQQIASNETMEDNSLIKVDGRGKKNDEDLAEHSEKLVKFYPLKDNKASDLGRNTETIVFLEDQRLAANSQGIPNEKTEELTDGADTEKQTQEQQNVAISDSNEDSDRNSSIQLDASQMKHVTYLENEIEKAELIEASAEDINDESTVMHEAEMGNESIRKIEFSESGKNTCTPDEQSLTANPQSSTSEITIDITDTKEVNLEHVATKMPHEHTDNNLPVQVDCLQTEDGDHLAKESENLSLAEASLEDNTKLHDNRDSKDHIEAELLENERNTVSSAVKEEAQVENEKKEETADDVADMKTPELQNVETSFACEDTEENSRIQIYGSQLRYSERKSENTPLAQAPARDTSENTLAKEEAEMEKPTEYEQVPTVDIKIDMDTCSITEQIPIADPQEISSEKKEENTIDATHTKDVTINFPDDSEYKLPTEIDGLQKIALEEASAGNSDDDESKNIHEDKFVNESLKRDDSFKNKECISIEKEVFIESLQKADEDIGQHTEISIYAQEKHIEDTVTRVPNGDNEDNTAMAVYGLSEPPFKEASTRTSNDVDPSTIHEPKFGNQESIRADRLGTEKCKEGILVNEKVSIEKSQESLTTNSQEIMSHHKEDKTIDATEMEDGSPQNKNIATIVHYEEVEANLLIQAEKENYSTNVDGSNNQSSTEVSTGSITEVQDIATNTTNANNVDNSPNKVDFSSKENSAHHESRNMHEHGFLDETLPKADEVENEKNIDDPLVKENITYECVQVTSEGIKASASGQDIESSQDEETVTTDREIMEEDKTTDASFLNKETPNEMALKPVDVENPHMEAANINTDMVVDIAEDHDCYEHVTSVTSSASEPSEQDCDKTDTEKMTALNAGSTKIPINENLDETDPKESSITYAQVPDEENRAEFKQDTDTGASQDASDSSDYVALEEFSSSNAAPEKDSTSNPFPESRKEEQLEPEDEEAQKQDEDLNVSVPDQDSSMKKEENGAYTCPESATEMQKLEKAPLAAPGDNTLDSTNCKESDVAEDAFNSFLNDNKLTKGKQEEIECKQERVFSDEAVEEIKEPVSMPVANDFLPQYLVKVSEIDHSTAERQEVENISVGEASILIYQCERVDYERNSNEVGFAPEESKTGYQSRNQALESIDQVQSCGIILKAKEDLDHAEAAEIKSETVLVEDIFQPNETMKVEISCDKIKKEEDENVQNDHNGSCKEEAITECRIENQAKQEERATEEICEELKNPSETEKVSEDPEEAVDKAVEDQEQKLHEENESVDKSLQKEQGKSIENVVKTSDSGEAHSLDHSYINTGTQDSGEEVNGSTVAYLEHEDNFTRAGDVYHEILKDEGFQNQDANTSGEDAAFSEESNSPLSKCRQGIESENQHQKYECSSDKVQVKDEVKNDTTSEPTEGEDIKTYSAVQMVDFSSHTKDITEVSQHDAAEDVPADNENSTTKNKNQEIKVPCEGQEPEVTQKAPVSETLTQEVEEQQLERTKSTEESQDKHSLSNRFEANMKGTTQIANQCADEKETTPHNEDLQAEKADEVDHEDIKTDEEKDDAHESCEQMELGSEAPVMVDMGDADSKVAHHKKSHNILSGVGSKVKHSIAKVKKAIAGKSSHPKPTSPN